MKTNFYAEIARNNVKSLLLLGVFTLLVLLIGSFVGFYMGDYRIGIVLSIIIGVVYGLIMYYSGDNVILSMTGAKPANKDEHAFLVNSVEGLAIAAGLPTPKIYVIHDTALNAFATGRDPKHAAITVTTGLMDKLNREELEGVVAHEMAHIKNYDIRLMLISVVFIGIIAFLSEFLLRSFLWGGGRRDNNGGAQIILIVVGLVLAILAPLIAQLIKLAISRKREFMADAEGARLTRYPQGLANALKKIKGDPDPLVDTANHATAHLFISTPFRKKKKSWFESIWSTHPPIDERIQKLESM